MKNRVFTPGGGGCQNSASLWAGFPDFDQESCQNYITGQTLNLKLSVTIWDPVEPRKKIWGSLQLSADHSEPPKVTLPVWQISAAWRCGRKVCPTGTGGGAKSLEGADDPPCLSELP